MQSSPEHNHESVPDLTELLSLFLEKNANVFFRLHRLTEADKEITKPTWELALEILSKIISKPTINKVFFIGPPGTGKTVCLSQLGSALEVLSSFLSSSERIETKWEFFDPYSIALKYEYAPTTDRWTREQWNELDNRMYRAVSSHLTSDEENRSDLPRKIVLVEVPFWGVKPRGRGLLERYIREDNEKASQGAGPETLVISLLAEQRVRTKAGLLRDHIRRVGRTNQETVWPTLSEVYALPPKSAVASEAELLKQVINSFEANAPYQHIREISGELLAQAEYWYRDNPKLAQQVVDNFRMPEEIEALEEAPELKLMAVYCWERLRILGLSPEMVYCVFNLQINEVLSMDIGRVVENILPEYDSGLSARLVKDDTDRPDM